MSRNGTVWILALALGVTVAGCEQRPAEETGEAMEPGEATAEAETQFESLRASYIEAWEARDADALVALHTEDYVEYTPEGERTSAEIHSQLADTAAQLQDASLSIEPEAFVVAESGDVAYETGSSTVIGTAPDGTPVSESSRYMVGFQKVDGEWKIHRLVLAPTAGETAPTVAPGAPTETPPTETPGTPADTAPAPTDTVALAM